MSGTTVRFVGTHQEVGDRSWDTYYDFESADAQIATLPLARTPSTIGESYQLFADARHPDESGWENLRIMRALHHRATCLPEQAAATIDSKSEGLGQIVPILFSNALVYVSQPSVYGEVLIRLGKPAVTIVELLDQHVALADKRNSKRLLAKMRSQKYLGQYIEELASTNNEIVRFAVKRIADIAERDAGLRALASLAAHPNTNVRWDAQDAIKKLNGIRN